MHLDPWKYWLESFYSYTFYKLLIGFQIVQFDLQLTIKL
jgi:hypothetical protein